MTMPRNWLTRIAAAALLVAAGLAVGAALPGPGDNPDERAPDKAAPADPPAGDLLIASAHIADPRFFHTVILVLKHDATGAFGIVINRPLEEKSIASLLAAAKDAKPGHRGDDSGVDGNIRVFAGGPVQRALGFVVHTPDYKRDATITAGPIVSMTPTTEALRDIGHHKGPAKYFFALGYAGWGPGQLEAEIEHHDWFSTPADEALIFDDDRGDLWKHALERRTRDL
ncbi:MAG TPA: YqgE/AlgH family protein [Stellaceae bacterium]|nr:YqgE/AlgH family protein [Stellaceae bacterium]